MAITAEMRTSVSQLYVALFGRAPDTEGLQFWAGRLDEGQTLALIANTMLLTTPARAFYPEGMSNGGIVASFYQNVLGRPADAQGLAFWTARLNSSSDGAGAVISEMIGVVANYVPSGDSALAALGNASRNLFNNKVAVAQYFGEHNGTASQGGQVLANVTGDASTVQAAIRAVDSGTVGASVQDGSPPPDITAPVLAITSSKAILQTGETAAITFSFTEDPGTSFTASDVTVTGGTLSAFAGTGLVRTATFTAAAATQLNAGAHISVAPDSFQDAAGNTGPVNGAAPAAKIATAFTPVLFVGNSATFGRVDPVMSYNAYDATTNPGGVHDLTSPERGGTFANLSGSNLYEAHPWGGVPGLVDKFADQVGLGWDVSISARNAATLGGHYQNSSPAGWDLRGNISSARWDMVVLQDQTDQPLPAGSGSITFAAGSSTATLVVTPRGDTDNESDETLALTLATAAGYRVGTSAAITGTILNDDPTAPATNPALPTVTLATTGSVLEDGHANLVFTFTRTGSTAGDLAVSFTPTRDGTQPSVASPLATAGDVELYSSSTNNTVAIGTSGSSARFSSGSGFLLDTDVGPNTTTGSLSFTGGGTGSILIKAGQTSASVTYDPRTDSVVEVDESIRFTLNSSASYNVGTQGAVTGTIVNDDFAAGTDITLPNVTLALSTSPSVYENSGQSLVYTFTRSGNTASALTVNFSESGTATYFAGNLSQSDFSLSTTGATASSLVTTGGANADIAGFERFATLIANYIHTGAADSTTVAGTTIAANANADASTDIYLYSTWARPDMVVGNVDMVTDKVAQPSGAWGGTGAVTATTTQGAGYWLRLEDMSAALTNAYTSLVAANSDFKGVAAVSTAFMNAVLQGVSIRDPYTEAAAGGKINLWFDDNLHASKYGSYLAALTLFQTLSGIDSQVLGSGDLVAHDLGIDGTTAIALQKVASATAGFDASLRWTAPGKVADLGGTNAGTTLATAGAYSFIDPAVAHHTVSAQPRAGALGTLTAAVRSDGNMGQVNWVYKVGNDLIDPLLAAGSQRTETFDVSLSDGAGHTVVETVAVTLVGTSL